jgi:hypothetical protein
MPDKLRTKGCQFESTAVRKSVFGNAAILAACNGRNHLAQSRGSRWHEYELIKVLSYQIKKTVTGESQKNQKPSAIVGLEVRDDGRFALEVEPQVKLPGIENAKVEELVAKADKSCAYSNAIRVNLPVKISTI